MRLCSDLENGLHFMIYKELLLHKKVPYDMKLWFAFYDPWCRNDHLFDAKFLSMSSYVAHSLQSGVIVTA